MTIISTKRLQLIAASEQLLAADLRCQMGTGGLDAFALALGVSAIQEWPPTGSDHDIDAVTFFLESIQRDPTLYGWQAFYVCLAPRVNETENTDRRLIGSAGYFGPPVDGEVEIGYAIAWEYRRRGFATEVVEALTLHAAGHGVKHMRARTLPENRPSVDLLTKVGFDEVESTDEHRQFRKALV
jgi:[ribosomal protein S5]-alanine N-acetyltransferase